MVTKRPTGAAVLTSTQWDYKWKWGKIWTDSGANDVVVVILPWALVGMHFMSLAWGHKHTLCKGCTPFKLWGKSHADLTWIIMVYIIEPRQSKLSCQEAVGLDRKGSQDNRTSCCRYIGCQFRALSNPLGALFDIWLRFGTEGRIILQ